mmetsp:Transcript_11553/g.30743  ORF Transcript_11553/g.30743 Transcript_11553/m.30743 type:complete len:478 (-) Transcript_11553:338-1771(-)
MDHLLRRLVFAFGLVELAPWKYDVQFQTLDCLLHLLASTWSLCVPQDGKIHERDLHRKGAPPFVRLLLCIGSLREFLLDLLVCWDESLPSPQEVPRAFVQSLVRHSVCDRLDDSLRKSPRWKWLKEAFPSFYSLDLDTKEDHETFSRSLVRLPAPSSSSSSSFPFAVGHDEDQANIVEEQRELPQSELDILRPFASISSLSEWDDVDPPQEMNVSSLLLDPLPSPTKKLVSVADLLSVSPRETEVKQAREELFDDASSSFLSPPLHYGPRDESQGPPPPHTVNPSDPVFPFRNYARWTKEDEGQLTEGVKTGKALEEIAKSLGRSEASCIQHVIDMKCKTPLVQIRLKWNDAMAASLKAKILAQIQREPNKKIPWTFISEEMKKEFCNKRLTKEACKHYWKRNLKPGVDRRSLTQKEKEEIFEFLLHKQNLSVTDIRKKIPSLAKRCKFLLTETLSHLKRRLKLKSLAKGREGEQTQ